jgi:hypothetical protein
MAHVKVMTVLQPTTISSGKHKEIHLNGTPILHVTTKHSLLSATQVDLHPASDPSGRILASAKLHHVGNDLDIQSGLGGWQTLSSHGVFASSYSFNAAGRQYSWTRTHDEALGAHKLGQRDFKLVDESSGRSVLAVFVFTQNMIVGRLKQIADIKWMAEVGQEVEIIALAAILGVEEKIKKSTNASGFGAFMAVQ